MLVAGTFSIGNGVPPTTGVNLVYDDAANATPTGAGKRDLLAASPSTGQLDLALDGALCQRGLVLGRDAVSGGPIDGEDAAFARRLRNGVEDVLLRARLRGKPTVIVHGRADALVPVNHSSRAYYGANQLSEGQGRRATSYVEVTNAQHFDAFLGFPGYAERFVPLHVYLIRALNSVYDHLTAGTPLPPSQVVRAVPRGAGAPPITAGNVPPIAAVPADQDLIELDKRTLFIPD